MRAPRSRDHREIPGGSVGTGATPVSKRIRPAVWLGSANPSAAFPKGFRTVLKMIVGNDPAPRLSGRVRGVPSVQRSRHCFCSTSGGQAEMGEDLGDHGVPWHGVTRQASCSAAFLCCRLGGPGAGRLDPARIPPSGGPRGRSQCTRSPDTLLDPRPCTRRCGSRRPPRSRHPIGAPVGFLGARRG